MPIIYESYAKSPEKAVAAQKRKTVAGCWLWDPVTGASVEGATLYVGTQIQISGALTDSLLGCTKYDPAKPAAIYIDNTEVLVYHRLNTGASELIRKPITGKTSDTGKPASCGFDIFYTLDKAGSHAFWVEYAGDPYYEGCRKAAKVLAR